MKKAGILFSCMCFVTAIIAQPCSQLFISEYIEGSSNNKAIEIFNPTMDTVSLSGYKIANYRNGAATTTNAYIVNLSGSILPHSAYAICRTTSSPALKAVCQDSVTSSALNYNGDDAIALIYGTDTIDVVGKIGEDPGTGWVLGSGNTANRTLVRMPNVHEGTNVFAISATQWLGFPNDDFSHIGSHSFEPCVEDTVLRFSAIVATADETDELYDVVLSVSQPAHANTITAKVFLKSVSPVSADASDLNGFSSVTVTFPPNMGTVVVPIAIMNDTIMEPLETFMLGISEVTGGAILGADSLFTLTIIDDDTPEVVYPYYPIEIITTENSYGVADSLDVHCWTTGVVYGVNTQPNGLRFIIADHTGWIQVYSPNRTFGYVVQEGDSVLVQGVIGQRYGMTEMSFLDTVIKISSGNGLQEPKIIAAALSEGEEARLIRVNGLTLSSVAQWTNAGEGFTVTAKRGIATYKIYIDALTTAFALPAPTGTFDAIGWVSQNDSCNPQCLTFYQIHPRYAEDIILTAGVEVVEKNEVLVYPNPAKEAFTLLVNIDADDVIVTMYNAIGKVAYKQHQPVRDNTIQVKADLPVGFYYGTIDSGKKKQLFRVEILR